jgi:pimeloyl-ACP methyl ester carboxylesterase
MPPEIHEEQAAGIRGADLVLLGDCGHLSSIEQPERVNAALAGWLARVSAGAR